MRRLCSGVFEDPPREALACWGARATILNGRWSIPHERQDIVGPAEEREELARVMNGGLLRDAETEERRHFFLRTYPQGKPVCMLDRPSVVVFTRTFGGIVLVTAYIRSPERNRRAARMGRRRRS